MTAVEPTTWADALNALWGDGWRVERADFFDAHTAAGLVLRHPVSGERRTMHARLDAAPVSLSAPFMVHTRGEA